MNKLKIGIIEDEMVIADTIAITLRKLGYEPTTVADNYNSALKMIEEEKPDLVLIDIIIKGQKDGIDLAHYIREKYPMPIIFLTANSDIGTVQRAKQVKPNAYLVKPFVKADLFAAIKIAIANHLATQNPIIDFIMVKDGYDFVKVFLKEIKFITSDHNYATLYLNTGKRIMVRSTMTEMEEKLDKSYFIRINRGTLVNKNYVSKIETEKVRIDDNEFTVAKKERDQLVKMMEQA